MNVLLSIFYLLFTSCGVTFMKLGGNSISLSLKNVFEFKIGYLTIIGFVFYVLSFILWQKLLVTFNLSYIFPILTGITQIILLLISVVIFKETINVYNILGILLIIVGISLIALKGGIK